LSIVVLPFENMSGDKEQDYFADGITDDLTTAPARQFRHVLHNADVAQRGEISGDASREILRLCAVLAGLSVAKRISECTFLSNVL
jgi:TolB-like protein